ncbi:hypothetical protein ACGGZK_16470 [Agromyces sp. MMS24-K17]|uniref:hypothetical protein n=1 Tax=Agromyces sp. MMS24-K17 TaxID=3372850 RepID=UPI003754B60E
MRWDRLFDDLESQLDREHEEEERALAFEEERLRLSRLTLRDRITAMAADGRGDATGAPSAIRLELAGGERLAVRPDGFGRDWLSGDLVDAARSGAQALVPLDAIVAVLPMREQLARSLAGPAAPAGRLVERIGIAFILRDLSRRRIAVSVSTHDGRFHGTIDRVARDHLDLALHEPGSSRRERDLQGYRIIPIARLVSVVFD